MWTVGVGPCACAMLNCLACLSISVYCRRCGWVLNFTDVCHAMTVIALIIAMQRATCICAEYHLISGRRNIFSKPSYTAAKNPRIRTNGGKVCRFGCELEIRNNTRTNSVTYLTTLILTLLKFGPLFPGMLNHL